MNNSWSWGTLDLLMNPVEQEYLLPRQVGPQGGRDLGVMAWSLLDLMMSQTDMSSQLGPRA